MEIRTSLIVFASDNNSAVNKYVLIQNNDFLYEIMHDNSPSSFTLIETMVKNSMGITGRWNDIRPKLIGVLDEPEYLKQNGERYITLVYSLYMQDKNTLNSGYKWILLNEIDNNNIISDITKGVIRYAATHI